MTSEQMNDIFYRFELWMKHLGFEQDSHGALAAKQFWVNELRGLVYIKKKNEIS